MTRFLFQLWSSITKGNVGVILSEDLFVEIMKAQAFDPAFANTFVELLETSFSIVDANADGSIDLAELSLFFESYGLDTSVALPSFAAMDADGDGLISKDEFSASGLAFFTSEDEEHPSKLFYGPLI